MNGNGGSTEDYIRHLDPGMAEAVRQLNEAMGGTLQITSGYRSAEYQAELCQRVDGPCAPPGRSMHQYGMAIDVQNWQAARDALAANPDIAICWLNIPNDAWHFSYQESRECGGRQGVGGGNGVGRSGGGVGGGGVSMYGMSMSSIATFNVHLVDDDYGVGLPFGSSSAGGSTNGRGLGDPNDPRSWAALEQCESSGNPRAVNQQTGRHFGLYQFDIPTWQSVGGTGNPADASPEEQRRRARMLYAQRGWQPWECAANMGWPLNDPSP
jgi:hypothetical protein